MFVYARRVASQGTPHSRFQRALKTGNLVLIRTAAKEVGNVNLQDALTITLLMERDGDEGFERAAAKWLARLALEVPGVRIGDLRAGAEALDGLPDPEAQTALRDLCARHGLGRVTQELSS